MNTTMDIRLLSEACSKSQEMYGALMSQLVRNLYEIGNFLDNFRKLQIDRLNFWLSKLDTAESVFQVLQSTFKQCFKQARRNVFNRMNRRLEYARVKFNAVSFKMLETLQKFGILFDEMRVFQKNKQFSMTANTTSPDQQKPPERGQFGYCLADQFRGLDHRNTENQATTNHPPQLEMSTLNYGEFSTDSDETIIDIQGKRFHTLENFVTESLNLPSSPSCLTFVPESQWKDQDPSHCMDTSSGQPGCFSNFGPTTVHMEEEESVGEGMCQCPSEAAPSTDGNISSTFNLLNSQEPSRILHGAAKTNRKSHCKPTCKYWLRKRTASNFSGCTMAAPVISEAETGVSCKRQCTTVTQPVSELAAIDEMPMESLQVGLASPIAQPNICTEITETTGAPPISSTCFPPAPASSITLTESVIPNERFKIDSTPNVIHVASPTKSSLDSEDVSRDSQLTAAMTLPANESQVADQGLKSSLNQDGDVELGKMYLENRRNFRVFFTEPNELFSDDLLPPNFWESPLEDVELPAEMIDEIDQW